MSAWGDVYKRQDLDRVAFMDVVIMQIALAEILSFPNIPVSVSLNEYVEIAKLYSTCLLYTSRCV